MNDLIKQSKFLSLILRHNPGKIGITLDSEGWANIKDLVEKGNFTEHELRQIVYTDKKSRYKFDPTGTKIRANQGHSIAEVDIKFDKIKPPEYLYHGTVEKYVKSILRYGLQKQNRNYLHLSVDRETATEVGSRRGDAVILKIYAAQMYLEGFQFYISENGVYLIDFVPPKYIFVDKE